MIQLQGPFHVGDSKRFVIAVEEGSPDSIELVMRSPSGVETAYAATLWPDGLYRVQHPTFVEAGDWHGSWNFWVTGETLPAEREPFWFLVEDSAPYVAPFLRP